MNLFGMKKHRIRSLWLLLLLLTCSVTVWAQGSSVTGRVSDEKGELHHRGECSGKRYNEWYPLPI